MAGNLSAIITANGDSNASVWAFRQLQETGVPRILYGTVSGGSGASGGPITVILPIAYSTSTSYVVHITMRDSPAAQVYAAPVTATTFQFGWQNGGGGAQYFSWTTIGT
jgi:hypothetical protein